MHAYHHPEHIRPDHQWVDWFADFDAEGLWAEKLVFVAVLFSIGIIVASIIWCVLGGDLQTVFTVMSFVLTLVAGESSTGPIKGGRILTFTSSNRVGGTLLSGCLARLKHCPHTMQATLPEA